MNQSKKLKPADISRLSIGEIVAGDYRTAAVFKKHGIDFCCGGQVPLQTVCRERGIKLEDIHREIEAARSGPDLESGNPAALNLADLADLIVNRHHAYLKENLGQIADYVRKISEVHGTRHPELVELATIFDQITADMGSHLHEEEELLFPALKRSQAALNRGLAPESKDRFTIMTSLQRLHREHEVIGEALHQIRHLSKGFEIPEDACNTFAVTYRNLVEFERDLHQHVHLENNILFLRAAKLFPMPESHD